MLVLELLAAVCLVPSGHKKVLEAFDNFKEQMKETARFQTLMHLLRTERKRVGVMVAAMAFINVVVHCVPDMNYQVALQHEFTRLGIISTLELMEQDAADELREQIEAYVETTHATTCYRTHTRCNVQVPRQLFKRCGVVARGRTA